MYKITIFKRDEMFRFSQPPFPTWSMHNLAVIIKKHLKSMTANDVTGLCMAITLMTE